MGGQKSKPVRTPFEQKTTYAPMSVTGTPEAQAFLDVPLDFGEPVNVDPGVGRRMDLAEQEIENRYNSALGGGIPSFIREMNRARDLRQARGQGAVERQQAEFLNQQANNALRTQRTTAELERRRLLLPQFLQTGASGYGTQVTQPSPGFFSSFGQGLGSGVGQALPYFI